MALLYVQALQGILPKLEKILFPEPIFNKDVAFYCKANSCNWNPFSDMGTNLQQPRFAPLPFLIVGISRLSVLL